MNPIPALAAWCWAGPVVAVQAQLGVVREVRTELDEERAEVFVHAVEVVVVDHPGGLHDPWVGMPVGVATFLGTKHRCLLLGPSDEHHTLGGAECGQALM